MVTNIFDIKEIQTKFSNSLLYFTIDLNDGSVCLKYATRSKFPLESI